TERNEMFARGKNEVGFVVSGLNHLAHLGAAAIEEGKTNRQIKTAIVNDCGEDYLNQPVTENTLKDMAIVFKEIYDSGAKDYAFATEENLFGKLELNGGQLSSDGQNANGVTNMFTGKVLFSPNLLGTKTMLNFAATWYHESIHSFHAVSGFFINTMKSFKNSGLSYDDAVQSAINVSETIAHLQTQNYGLGIVFPTPVSTIRSYGTSYVNFLNLK
ncbi:hypothetical protein, partial [Epilithonimonas hominis]|uniref:hypothetical protein n=1 Tax=Epilithonimonas hominis TaxID=420404 RepID=UPI00289BFDA4